MLQPQIVQSPARLGLANPLRPLFRTLRLQKSLHSRNPISPQPLSLSSCRSLEPNPFSSKWPPLPLNSSTALESSPSSTKEILSQFTALQTQLFEAVAELQEILDLQDAKLKIAREVKSKDAALLSFSKKLGDVEQVLDNLVDDYSDFTRPKRTKQEDGADDDSLCTTTVSSQLNLSNILSYAHWISYTTFAPPEFGAGQAPLRGALPPAPQDEQMRASQLYAFANLDVGLPKTVEGKEETMQAMLEPLNQQINFPTWVHSKVCFLPTSQSRQVGSWGCLWNCQPNFLLPRPDGSLGTLCLFPHLNLFQFLGSRTNN